MDITDSGNQEKGGQEESVGGPDAAELRDEEQELLAKLEEANRYTLSFCLFVRLNDCDCEGFLVNLYMTL